MLAFLFALAAGLEVQYHPSFEANMTLGGEFTFMLNRTVWNISVSAGPDGRLRYRDLEGVSRPPDGMTVYKYIEITKVNAVSDITLVFAVPKNWLKNNGADEDNVAIVKRVGGDWVMLNRYYQDEDLLRHFFRTRMESLSTFAIGVVHETKVTPPLEEPVQECESPSEWSQCIAGKRARTVYEKVDGNCLPKNEVMDCAVELAIRTDRFTTVAALGMLTIAALMSAAVIQNKGKPF